MPPEDPPTEEVFDDHEFTTVEIGTIATGTGLTTGDVVAQIAQSSDADADRKRRILILKLLLLLQAL